MIIFHKFYFYLLASITKQIKIQWKRSYMCYCHFMQFLYKSLRHCPKNIGKSTKLLKILNTFSITLNTTTCPSQTLNKIKAIGYVTTCDILIVSCNSNINHSFICLSQFALCYVMSCFIAENFGWLRAITFLIKRTLNPKKLLISILPE